MKKPMFWMVAVLLMAFVLSACGGANNNGDISLTPGLATPGLVGTEIVETPMAGDDLAETPAGPVIDVTPTLAVTDVMAETPTVAADLETTGTPQANVPVTGDGVVCTPNRLSSMLDMEVGFNGELVGEVDAVVIYRDATIVVDEDTDDAVEEGVVVVDPTTLAAPRVAYAIIDLDDASDLGDKDVLVPFSALTLPAASAAGDVDNVGDTGSTDAGSALTATPDAEAGAVDNTVEQMIDPCSLTLAVDQSVLAAAPNIDDNAWEGNDVIDWTGEGWDEPYRTYWTGQGMTFEDMDANTGAQLGNAVVVGDEFDDVDVMNLDGDDLGEMEDFILDENGQFTHGILAAGGFLGLGERFIPIPSNRMAWINEDDDMEDLGEIVINVPEDAFENAPSLENLDDLDWSIDWSGEYDTYWESVTPAGTQP